MRASSIIFPTQIANNLNNKITETDTLVSYLTLKKRNVHTLALLFLRSLSISAMRDISVS
jgi:hypothetical protein